MRWIPTAPIRALPTTVLCGFLDGDGRARGRFVGVAISAERCWSLTTWATSSGA
jgi:hypothetical protein